MTSIPELDFDKAVEQYHRVFDAINSLGSKLPIGAFVVTGVAYLLAGQTFVCVFVVLAVLQVCIALGTWFGEATFDAIDIARESNRGQLNELIASVVNEMLGTSYSGTEFASSGDSSNSLEQSKNLGDSLLRVFEDGFGLEQGVTPEGGKDNAKKFLGFGVNFAVSQGFLSILAETASVGLLKEFHELPDGLMKAMGLGRLQRQALA